MILSEWDKYFVLFFYVVWIGLGCWGIIVGIVIMIEAGRLRDWIPVPAGDFSIPQNISDGLWDPHSFPHTHYQGYLFGKSGQSIQLTSNFNPVLRSRMSGAKLPLPLYAITAWTGATLHLLLLLWLGLYKVFFFLYRMMYRPMCPTGVCRTTYRFLCLPDLNPN